jgi:TolB-like protein/class 3 adenylate cyclase
MVKDQLSGKLAVILHADVAGSTSLVQQDKLLAHERIRDSFRLFSDTIKKYQGHVLELRGDALLAEFEHASEAVTAALSFQADHAVYNARLKDDLQLGIRVGISMGEVVIADNTVTGAGVVQAQRVEQIADSGGVCITAAIHESLSKRMPFDLESLGEQELKGFDHPVHVYRVELRPGDSVPSPESQGDHKASSGQWKQSGIIAAVLLIIATASFYWIKPPNSEDEFVPAKQAVAPLPDKPSIAVLPFTNMSTDAEQEYFADGMTEDLITDLSKISGLFVISRNSVFTYKGQAVKIPEVARELGVRYVMEGSVRRAGNQVRVNAQLIDATTGGHIWAERYDGTYEDIFSLQDKITSKIVASLAVKLTQGEQYQIAQKETDNTEAYDTFLKGWEQYLKQTPESFRQALSLFKKATELDPGYSRAYAALSLTLWQGWKRYWHNNMGYIGPHDIRFEAEEYLARAMEEPTPLALQISTAMLAQWGRHDEAVAEGERAIATDPNSADGYVALAGALNLAGYPDKALPLMEKAVRLNPHYPTSYLYELGLARYSMEQYDEAAVVLERAEILNPDDRWSSRLLIATLGQLNRTKEAVAIIDRIEGNWRGFDPLSVRGVAFWYPFKEPADVKRLADGLRKAGVPD